MPSDVIEFAPPGKPLRKFRVALHGGGSPKLVVVEDQKPFIRKLMRHAEKVRDLGDGRKKTDMILDEIEHTYDFSSDMRADAVRAYNSGGSAFSFKQLDVEDLGPVETPPEPPVIAERPRRQMPNRAELSEPAAVGPALKV